MTLNFFSIRLYIIHLSYLTSLGAFLLILSPTLVYLAFITGKTSPLALAKLAGTKSLTDEEFFPEFWCESIEEIILFLAETVFIDFQATIYQPFLALLVCCLHELYITTTKVATFKLKKLASLCIIHCIIYPYDHRSCVKNHHAAEPLNRAESSLGICVVVE